MGIVSVGVFAGDCSEIFKVNVEPGEAYKFLLNPDSSPSL
jgi:hypothetical protein